MVDVVPLGPLRLRTVYVAAIEPVSSAEIRGHAWQTPGVRLTTVYSLTELRGGEATRLREDVFVEAPFGLRHFVIRRARESHAEMLQRMKVLLEGG